MSEELERTLPHNLEAERSVLGAILVHNDAYEAASHVVKADDFFRDAHRRIFTAIAHLVDELRVDVDFVTLKEELLRRGDLDEVGGPAYISSLADGVPRATNVRYYAGIVKEKATLRALIYAANKMLTDAYAAEDSAGDILARSDRAMLDVQNAHVSTRMSNVAESTTDLFKDFEHRVEHRGQLTGVDTGFASINELTFGWQPGDLIVVAARPSIGKTTFVMNTAVAGARTGKRVAFFSLEMRRRQLEYRVMSSLSGVACTRLLSGFVGSQDYPKISQAFETLSHLPVAIDDRARQTVQDIRGACRRLKAEGGLDLVVVDYVQLMPGTLQRKGATRNEELTDISRRMKVLADEIASPILMLSQLRRLEARRRPQLEDLRESGALEQDSDIVAFLHRSDHRAGGPTEFILAKQRNGPTGSVKLLFERDTLTFTDAGPDLDEEKPPEQPEMPGVEARRRRRRA
jgi:replicative DNA helicase